MNKDFILFHLTEAANAIRNTIDKIKSDPEYEYGSYRVDIEHIYHHVNSAWNAKDATDAAVKKCSQEDFDRWRQFPDPSEFSF
jgi:hypothetical protein